MSRPLMFCLFVQYIVLGLVCAGEGKWNLVLYYVGASILQFAVIRGMM